MREIKFRAWIKPIKKMLPVTGFAFHDPVGDVEVSNHHKDGTPFRCWKSDKEAIVMQYTGLKDMDGKEIYEGDIVDTAIGTGQVIYSERGGSFLWKIKGNKQGTYLADAFRDDVDRNEVDIIGNIYENPELINLN